MRKAPVQPSRFDSFPHGPLVVRRQSIVRCFLRQRFALFKLLRVASVPPRCSVVHMHARPRVSRRSRLGATHCARYPTEDPWHRFCSSRRDAAVLLFAELHGGSKTKQDARSKKR